MTVATVSVAQNVFKRRRGWTTSPQAVDTSIKTELGTRTAAAVAGMAATGTTTGGAAGADVNVAN